MSIIYDNWGKLVGATIKREQLRRIALQHSMDLTSDSDYSNDDSASEVLPGIEGLQIVGNSSKPGARLLACGYAVHGTSLVMFQWAHYHPDGTSQYLEGATDPEYIVTTDDVDRMICVECIPMNDQGQQGDLVRAFANNHAEVVGEEVPAIEGLQIFGNSSKLGATLLACGYPVHGTSLAMFQWAHCHPDGSRQYIEGATAPEYVVIVDDVDRLICVECIPINEKGQQGDVVRAFANNHEETVRVSCFPRLNLKCFTLLLPSKQNDGRARIYKVNI